MNITGFMLNYLFFDSSPTIITVFKLGILTSVIAFAFLFLFEKLRLIEKVKNKALLLFIAVLSFMIIDQLINTLTGAGFNLNLTGLIVLYATCFVGMVAGKWLKSKIQSRWQTPELLSSYLTILLLSWVGWLIALMFIAYKLT